MKVYLKDLAKMSRKERNRTLDEMARAATAHRDPESRLLHLFHAIQGFFMLRRASR